MSQDIKKLKLTELNRLSNEEYNLAEKIPLIVILDNIRSAHNTGSIFRTSDAFGIEAIYLCGITPTPPHKELSKTAIGAEDVVQWHYFKNTSEAIEQLKSKGYQVLAVEQTTASKEILSHQEVQPTALILGNEVHGISDEALLHIDAAIEISQYGTKHSLNVSVCAGVCLHYFSNLLRR